MRDCVHSGSYPFVIVSIRNRVHSEWCPFGIVSIRDCVHLRLCPFGMVSIRDGAHSGFCFSGSCTGSLVDHIWTNIYDLKIACGILIECLADHLPVILFTQFKVVQRKANSITRQYFSNANISKSVKI